MLPYYNSRSSLESAIRSEATIPEAQHKPMQLVTSQPTIRTEAEIQRFVDQYQYNCHKKLDESPLSSPSPLKGMKFASKGASEASGSRMSSAKKSDNVVLVRVKSSAKKLELQSPMKFPNEQEMLVKVDSATPSPDKQADSPFRQALSKNK